jgi:hypothetical protein
MRTATMTQTGSRLGKRLAMGGLALGLDVPGRMRGPLRRHAAPGLASRRGEFRQPDDDQHHAAQRRAQLRRGAGSRTLRRTGADDDQLRLQLRRLDEQARAILREQAAFIRHFPEVRFTVYGHTDLVGSDAYNHRLGLRRARAAMHYIISQGVDRSRLQAMVSRGETTRSWPPRWKNAATAAPSPR